jgi:WD40 repeat protein
MIYGSRALAFAPDGRSIAGFGLKAGVIDIVETATGKVRQRLGMPPDSDGTVRPDILSSVMAFSPDSNLLAAWNRRQEIVRIWDVRTNRETLRLPSDGEKHYHMQLAWSPDGRMLAVGDHRIQLYEVATGKLRREFTGHEGDVRCLAFSPDGRLLASGSMDTTVLIWDVWGK